MFCTNCGREIIDTARFCNYCGSPVQNIAPPPPPYPSQSMGQPYIPTPNITAPEQNNTVFQPETAENNVSDTFSETKETAPETSDTNAFDQTSSESPDVEETGIPVSEPIISGTVPEPEIISQQTAAGGMFSTEATPYPTPGNIPKSGGVISGTYSIPMPDTSVNISAPASSASQKRERKYTLGHILLCLASTAIMAITAGIFAGLYFSVV